MSHHVLHIPDLPHEGDRLAVTGDEAAHALRVKRVREGELLSVLDGRGGVATARVTVARRELELQILSREQVDPVTPMIEVWSAAPKGPRLGELIDNLSQVGASSWTPLRTIRANINLNAAKRKRLWRISVEAMKQSRRPWMLQIHKPASLDEALAPERDVAIVLADADGEPYQPRAADRIRLLVGPEGGWTEKERAAARAAGATAHRFGPHVMRIEQAAPVACAIALDHESRRV